MTLTYDDVATLVDGVPIPASGRFDIGDPATIEAVAGVGARLPGRSSAATDARWMTTPATPVAVLVAAFAAARLSVPVVVRDPDRTVDFGGLPPGTWLVALTSGSMGNPRAVCRTATSWVQSFAPLARIAGLSAADTVLIDGPLTSTLHLFAAVHAWAIGAQLTDRPEEATAVHAVPQGVAALVDALPPGSSLRTVVVAGSATPHDLVQRCLDRGMRVIEYYGAAELSFVAIRRAPEPLRPFPGVDLRVGDDGVLWARSPYLALGYTGAAGGALRRDADRFATVGDLAAVADDGTITIRGRGDAAINTGGHTVLAEDVEGVLATLHGVAGVAVVGLPHPRMGQITVAVFEPIAGAELRDIPRLARESLTTASRPRRYLVCDRLPRTDTGKIARTAVVDGLADGTLVVRSVR
jgi:acyl-CoA synthetase (AMP-forming)/AMP-acid ligase II